MRRLALEYDILALDQYEFEPKPGVWDPLVGLTGGYQWLYF